MERAGESYRGEGTHLSVHVPFYLKRVLLIDMGQGRLAQRLRSENGLEVQGIEADTVLDGKAPDFPPGFFGGIILRDFQGDSTAFVQILNWALPLLSETGQIYILAPNSDFWRCRLGLKLLNSALLFADIVRMSFSVGLKMYGFYIAEDAAFTAAPCDSLGILRIEGHELHLDNPEDRDTLACSDILFVFVRQQYSAVQHAESCRQAGFPDIGYEVLAHVPVQAQKDPEILWGVELGKLQNLYDWTVRTAQPDPLLYFSKGVHHFLCTVRLRPQEVPAYHAMAKFWNLIGGAHMGNSLLRSLEYALPGSTEHFAEPVSSSSPLEILPPPVWENRETMPRVLFVLPQRPHYGLDVLFDGLCRVLGSENVLDCPPKATLHGGTWPGLEDYPCMFHWPDTSMPVQETLARLAQGGFDLVIYGDCENELGADFSKQFGECLGDVPLFLFDAKDEACHTWAAVQSLLGGISLAGCFKREMLACVDYGPGVYPMPFSYGEERARQDFVLPRGEDFFWAGHRNSYIRRLYLEHIESRLGRSLDQRYALDEYNDRLSRARVGLNLFGFGFDTVRYWELPAHGCLLFSERPPIRIPNNFEDGKTAVFFDDLRECLEKLDHYLAHPEESEAIARAGHALYWRHHTNQARARDLLGYVRQPTAGKV